MGRVDALVSPGFCLQDPSARLRIGLTVVQYLGKRLLRSLVGQRANVEPHLRIRQRVDALG